MTADDRETATGWTTTLDAFEQRLRDVRDATVAGATTEVPAFTPAPDLGLLPTDMVDRAQDLLASAQELQQFIQQAHTAVSARISAPPETRAPRRASRLDISV